MSPDLGSFIHVGSNTRSLSRVTEEHKDLDMIILNSGIQRGLDFGKPESIDLDAVDLEMQTNYFSYIHLVKAFLPFLQSKSEPTAIVFMTSGLALAPLSRCPNYCASKAALHSLIMSMRFQLQQAGKGDIKIIEILPPAVQSKYLGKSLYCNSRLFFSEQPSYTMQNINLISRTEVLSVCPSTNLQTPRGRGCVMARIAFPSALQRWGLMR